MSKMKSSIGVNPFPKGFTIIESVLASVVLAYMMYVSSSFWNKTTEGMKTTSLRAKIDSAIARRGEEIKYCSRFYEIETAYLVNPTEKDCRLLRLKQTQEANYKESSNCSTTSLGLGLKNYLSSNSPDLLASYKLTLSDPGAESIEINIKSIPDGNTLILLMESNFGSSTTSKSTRILPYAHSWCAFPYQ